MPDPTVTAAPAIEALIPHRGAMRLIETIVETGPDVAVTAATARPSWPLCDAAGVSPLVTIELAAQTAAVSIGWQQWHSGAGTAGRGWLVGIREALFFMPSVPLGARILTRSRVQLRMEGYTEVVCTASVDGRPVGQVMLQVMRAAEGDAQPGPQS
jgi:predicted hotdog family 3-hydroxylacyl-ACP dehydratase